MITLLLLHYKDQESLSSLPSVKLLCFAKETFWVQLVPMHERGLLLELWVGVLPS